MKAIVSLTLLGLIVVGAYSQCQYAYQAQVTGFPPGFCIELCSNPIYLNCPTSPPLTSSEYCALLQVTPGVTRWAPYTYTCDACANGATIGFYFGACSCQFVTCPSGQVCNGGNCVPRQPCAVTGCTGGQICLGNNCVAPQCSGSVACPANKICDAGQCRDRTCADITCPNPGDTCEGGFCYKKYDNFCSLVQPQIIRNYCPLTRPSPPNCPNNQSPDPFVSAVCGVSSTGELLDFDQSCEACKRAYVQYYYNQPCSQVPRRCAGS